MKINRAILQTGVPHEFVEEVDFSSVALPKNQVRAIPHCVVKAIATEYEDILRVSLTVNALVTAICSYTLEDVELKIKVEDELNFTDDEYDENNIHDESTEIDLDGYILAMILEKIPLKVVKKGAKLPANGNGYRVLTEDQLAEERANKKDSRFDILDKLDLD